MKIYTRTGDDGTTALVGGARVGKDDPRLEAYGGVDELNAHLGVVRSGEVPGEIAGEIAGIQGVLFVIGARLATDLVENPRRPTSCPEEEVTRLERAIDRLVRELSPQYYFLLPGGHPIVAACHVARTVCRRVERRVVTLEALAPVDEVVKRYLNRLSDYLFVLARYLARHFGVTELTWKP